MRLDRQWIAAHIPHHDGMCLLDDVIEWTEGSIRCRSRSHRAADNPLRAHGRLGAACGIEYAAQAMAIHGALRAADSALTPRPGLLASVRSVAMSVERLDDIEDDLIAGARYIHGDTAMVLYEFEVATVMRILLAGRATIAFGATGSGPNAMWAAP